LIAFSITAAISPRQIPNPIIASPIAAIKIPIREECRKRPVMPLRFEDKNPILKSTPFHTLILSDCLINIQQNFFQLCDWMLQGLLFTVPCTMLQGIRPVK